MFYILCSVFYVLCSSSMLYVLCYMFYILCSMFYVLCSSSMVLPVLWVADLLSDNHLLLQKARILKDAYIILGNRRRKTDFE